MRSRKTIASLILTCAFVLGTVLSFGQACSPSTLESLTGTSRNNGGGYGGLTSTVDGTYDTGSVSQPTSLNPVYFYQVGSHLGCTNYPAGYETVGDFITGVIRHTGGFTYAPSLCDSPISGNPSDLDTVGFDDRLAIYQNQIFLRSDQEPPPAATLTAAIVTCRNVSHVGAYDYGTVTTITQSLNGNSVAHLVRGRDVATVPTRFTVSPFAVSHARTSGLLTINGSSYLLEITLTGSAQTTGTLTMNLDGIDETLSMNCWVGQP